MISLRKTPYISTKCTVKRSKKRRQFSNSKIPNLHPKERALKKKEKLNNKLKDMTNRKSSIIRIRLTKMKNLRHLINSSLIKRNTISSKERIGVMMMKEEETLPKDLTLLESRELTMKVSL